jgi:hypothetical protein
MNKGRSTGTSSVRGCSASHCRTRSRDATMVESRVRST